MKRRVLEKANPIMSIPSRFIAPRKIKL